MLLSALLGGLGLLLAVAPPAFLTELLSPASAALTAMSGWHLLFAWSVSALLLLLLLTWQEKSAAMRGTHRAALSPLVDKGLRLLYLLLLSAPLLLLAPRLAAVALLPYIPTYVDGSEKQHGRSGSAHAAWLRRWRLWGWMSRQIGLRMVCTAPLPADEAYILCLHPHGILPFGSMLNFCSDVNGVRDLLPGVRYNALAASFCFYLPGVRELYLAAGIIDAARYVAEGVLRSGRSLVLVPGGASEALHARPGSATLILQRRRGFIKLALETGAALVPVYSFGETNTYMQVESGPGSWVSAAKAKFQSVFGMSMPLVRNLLPLECQVTTVVGKPIPVERASQPSDEQVEALKARYIVAVRELFAANASKYCAGQAPKLEII